jgi:hypothetical protein
MASGKMIASFRQPEFRRFHPANIFRHITAGME